MPFLWKFGIQQGQSFLPGMFRRHCEECIVFDVLVGFTSPTVPTASLNGINLIIDCQINKMYFQILKKRDLD